MKRTYPVIFTEAKDVILVEVPDLDIFSEGKNIENAIDMARDAISIAIVSKEDNNEFVPDASKINDIDIKKSTFFDAGNSFVSIVDVDVDAYRKKIDTRPVRRNVSLPCWLNEAADKAGINVSGVLQEALMKKLHIAKKY